MPAVGVGGVGGLDIPMPNTLDNYQLVGLAIAWRRHTKVKHARDPIIVVAREMDIFLDAHDARVGERRL